MSNILKIQGIETNNGIFITNGSSYITNYYFDGKKCEKTNHLNWYKLDSLPQKIESLNSGGIVNYRYVIKDECFINDKAKKEFAREDVAYYDDDENEWFWKDEFSSLSSLYKLEYDKAPDYFKEMEFEYTKVAQIDNLPEVVEFKYPAQVGSWRHEGMGVISNNNIQQQELDKIIFPSPLLVLRPCKLSSKASYDLVREYIKINIDPNWAEITSDYNFCFAVKKKIHLSSPDPYTVDINNNTFSKRKKTPKYVTKYRTDRSVTIFEMTYSPENYQKYTPIKGFEGNSHEELSKNIEIYLINLITEINKPLVDCPHCKGLGVIDVITPLPTNTTND